MATNQMRREAAKRKLERQQQRRVEQAKRKQRVAIITVVAVVVVVVVAVVLLTTLGTGGGTAPSDNAAAPPSGTAVTPTAAATPAAGPPPAPGQVNCAYPADGNPAKPNQAPKADGVTATGTVAVALTTSSGPIGLTLDEAQAPCTVNSFVSLVGQKYFDGTPCHRLTTTDGLKVLQCGDPTGAGTGGPGYTIPDEPPVGLAPSPEGGAVIYPRGSLAMAKTSAPNSGGSQFFLVYGDSTLPPDYTVFGKVDAAGLTTLDTIAKAGSNDANGTGDGAPKTPVTIQTATVGG